MSERSFHFKDILGFNWLGWKLLRTFNNLSNKLLNFRIRFFAELRRLENVGKQEVLDHYHKLGTYSLYVISR